MSMSDNPDEWKPEKIIHNLPDAVLPPEPAAANDVSLAALRQKLYQLKELTPDEAMTAMAVALMDVQFARAVEAAIAARDDVALVQFIREALPHLDQPPTTKPRTIRETVRQMSATALRALIKYSSTEVVDAQVKEYLDVTLRHAILAVLGVDERYSTALNVRADSVLGRKITERITQSVEAQLDKALDRALADLSIDWEASIATVVAKVRKDFRATSERKMQDHLHAEAQHRLKALLARALEDAHSGEGDL